MRLSFRNVLPLTLAVLLAAACTVQRNPVTGNQRLMAYTWSQEVEIGREVDQEFSAQFGLYDNQEIADYIERLGQEVLTVSHMRREETDRQFRETEFFFRVLDSPVINAFALPGGYVYVTRGLLSHLNNEAQLVVVLGHEIGHVAARHASQRALRQNLGQIAIIGGAILGQEFLGLPGESIMELSSQAAQLIFLSYGRDAERESDRLGVEYAARLGYEAAEGAAFFTSLKRISDHHGHSIPTMLSSHPDPGERESNIPRLAEQWAERGFEQHIRNEESYLRMLEGMIVGDNPREGFVTDNRFVHPDLAFAFPVPSGWQLVNEQQQVVLIAPEENAVMILRLDNTADTPQASVDAFTSQEGVTLNSQSERTLDSGLQAFKADVTIPQDRGNLRALIYAVAHGDHIYRFINYTTESTFDTHEQTLHMVPEGFHTLTDQHLLDTQPARIRLVQVDDPASFRSFLPASLPQGLTAEELAIMNQVELDETMPAGRLLKIPAQ